MTATSTIRAFIVEDIPANLTNLCAMLTDYCPQVRVEGHAATVDDAYQDILQCRPDLIFLDIGLGDKTGFDLLARLESNGQLSAEILFLTGDFKYEYATRAFEYSAVDFINKPVDPAKLCRAIEKTRNRLDKNQYKEQIRLLLDLLQQPQPRLDGRLALHLPKGVIEVVQVPNIVRCKADGVITYVMMSDGTKYTANRNLGHYGELLVRDYNFFPIDHGEIINLDYLRRYDPRERAATLHDGSVRYASRIKGRELDQYLKQNPPSKTERGLLDRLRKWFQ